MTTTLETPPTPPKGVRPLYWPTEQVQQQSSSPGPTPTQACACTQGAALTVQQGATLSTKLTLTVTDKSVSPPVTSPVDVTGCTFQFTAKIDPSYADDDPSTVKIDWQETSTPQQGTTWLVVPAGITDDMQPIAYQFQIRMVSPSGVVTPLVQGTLTVTEPISTRH